MSKAENEFALKKNELKLFTMLNSLGGQTRQEILLSSELQAEKIEKALTGLLEKNFLHFDEETGLYVPNIPLDALISILDGNKKNIDNTKQAQVTLFQEYQNLLEEKLVEYQKTLKTEYTAFDTNIDQFRSILQGQLENWGSEAIESLNQLLTEINSLFESSTSESESKIEELVSKEVTELEKTGIHATDSLKSLSPTSERIFKESVTTYEQAITDMIKSTNENIVSLHSQLSDIVNAIEIVTSSQLQELITSTSNASSELQTNLGNELQDFWKNNREFVNELRQQVQVTFIGNVTKSLQQVVDDLNKDLTKKIQETLNNVRQQTETIILNHTSQFQESYVEFSTNSKELLQEQKTSLEVLSTELSEPVADQKIERITSTFTQQLHAHLSSEINTLEANYRRVQKTATEVIEKIRQTAKESLVNQGHELERLSTNIKEDFEHLLARKERERLQSEQLSQSLEQTLGNLLVSIPMRSTNRAQQAKGIVSKAVEDISHTLKESSTSTVNEINKSLTTSQKRFETAYLENLEEEKKEFTKLISISEQLLATVTNLQGSFSESIESRFEQRAKVMNTELDAIARNFQKVLNGFESGIGNINDRINSSTELLTLESSFPNLVNQLQTDVTEIFDYNLTDSKEFCNQVDSSLQTHLDNTLTLIQDGFNKIKKSFTTELTTHLNQIQSKSDEKQQNLITSITTFSELGNEQITSFRSNLTKTLEENQKSLGSFITESRRGTEEAINLHKSNITKYQEKGPADILAFINQIESEVSTQNHELKNTLEELTGTTSGLADFNFGEISGIMTQFQESGDKIISVFENTVQDVTSAVNRAGNQIDQYFSDSMSELENHISVATGFVTSEIMDTTLVLETEIAQLKEDLEKTTENLNNRIKEVIEKQDQEFQAKLPVLDQNLSDIFMESLETRKILQTELEDKFTKSIQDYNTNWENQTVNVKDKLLEVSGAIKTSIDANIVNLDAPLQKNIDQFLKRMKSLYTFDTSKKDIFGLQEMTDQIMKVNKALKGVITEDLQGHVDNLDQLLPELLANQETTQTQTDELTAKYIEDLTETISSIHISITNQIHNYLKEERERMDFSEINNELNNILKAFNEESIENQERFSQNIAESVQLSSTELAHFQEITQELVKGLPMLIQEQTTRLKEEATSIQTNMKKKIESAYNTSAADLQGNFEAFNNELKKLLITLEERSTLMIQSRQEEFQRHSEHVLTRSNDLLNEIISTADQSAEILQSLKNAIKTTSMSPIRRVQLSSDDKKSEFLIALMENARKQVTFFMTDPTIIGIQDLKRIPAEKRVWIYTSYDFTKKGKKWLSELGNQVNINLRKSKASLEGIVAVQDENVAIILPGSLGIITTDKNLINNTNALLNILKGTPIKTKLN